MLKYGFGNEACEANLEDIKRSLGINHKAMAEVVEIEVNRGHIKLHNKSDNEPCEFSALTVVLTDLGVSSVKNDLSYVISRM